MKANSIENLLADQIFKITKADENISNYLLDCYSPFTDRGAVGLHNGKEIPFGTIGRLEGQIKKPLHKEVA